MRNKLTKVVFLVLIGIGGYFVWNYFMADPCPPDVYCPRAYTVIIEKSYLTGELSSQVGSSKTYVMEVNLKTRQVEDTFPIDIKRPFRIMLDPTGQELYVSGQDSLGPLAMDSKKPEWQDIHVYSVGSGQLLRKISLPEETDSVFSLSMSPNGERLFISNPYKEAKHAPTKEKRKKTWVLNPETGEFLFGVDAIVGGFFNNEGSELYYFTGKKTNEYIEPGFGHYDIDNEKFQKNYRDFSRLMKEQGGLHIEGIKFGYPHMEGNDPLRFYDRDTYDQIGKIDLEKGFESYDDVSVSLPSRDQITNNKQFVVVKVTVETGPHSFEYYFRIVDIQKMKIVDTIKVWSGTGQSIGLEAY